MRIAYFDCFSGISGDMALGALVDAGLSAARLRSRLSGLGVKGYSLSAGRVKKAGISAAKVTVRTRKSADRGHRHHGDIVKLIEKSPLSPEVKGKALAIFDALAEAEAKVHGVAKEKVHFHEVGAIDSIVDITGAAVGLVELGIDAVMASAVNTGSGMVMAEHGSMPVPAPATAALLRGVRSYAKGPEAELTTPTGAAILKALSASFGPRPAMSVERIGYGAGDRDFPGWPNVLRVFIGEAGAPVRDEKLVELWANIDDMNPQLYPDVLDDLLKAGALDAALFPIHMKKGRPAAALFVLCHPGDADKLRDIIFAGTTTLGIRGREVDRVSLPRRMEKVKTKYGVISVKVAEGPGGVVKAAPEFESVKKAARGKKVPFDIVYRAAIAALDF